MRAAGLPPGPRGAALLRSLWRVRRDRLRLLTDLAGSFGEVAGLRVAHRHVVFLSSHRAATHVLVDAGARYEKGMGLSNLGRYLGESRLTATGPGPPAHRATLASLFDVRFAPDWVRTTFDLASETAAGWRAAVREGGTVAVSRDLDVLSLKVAACALLGVALESEAAPLASSFSRVARLAMKPAFSPFGRPSRAGPAWIRGRRAARTIDRAVRAILERMDRRLADGRRADHGIGGGSGAGGMPPGEIAGLLFAGYDTTATAVAWALQLLAFHPEEASRCAREVDAVAGTGPLDADRVKRLVRLRAVLSEVLRLYPPVWVIPRRAAREDWILGYRIPRGTDVLVSVYAIHRDPDAWDHPDEFRPTRFLPGARKGGPDGAYLPFGLGPRSCAGAAFGVLEALTILAVILRALRVEPATARLPAAEPLLSLRPRRPIRLRLAPRSWPATSREEAAPAPAPSSARRVPAV